MPLLFVPKNLQPLLLKQLLLRQQQLHHQQQPLLMMQPPLRRQTRRFFHWQIHSRTPRRELIFQAVHAIAVATPAAAPICQKNAVTIGLGFCQVVMICLFTITTVAASHVAIARAGDAAEMWKHGTAATVVRLCWAGCVSADKEKLMYIKAAITETWNSSSVRSSRGNIKVELCTARFDKVTQW